MAYDESLAARIRQALSKMSGFEERRMFGGLAFLIRGHMCCGVVGDSLVLRLGNDGAAAALLKPNTRPMDFTGKPMKSMVYVEPAALTEDVDLTRWLDQAMSFVATLPPK